MPWVSVRAFELFLCSLFELLFFLFFSFFLTALVHVTLCCHQSPKRGRLKASRRHGKFRWLITTLNCLLIRLCEYRLLGVIILHSVAHCQLYAMDINQTTLKSHLLISNSNQLNIHKIKCSKGCLSHQMETRLTQIIARANLSEKGHKTVQDTHQDETSRLGQGPQSKSTQKLKTDSDCTHRLNRRRPSDTHRLIQ